MTIINLFPTTIYETYYKDDLTPYINKCIELKDKIECGGNKWREKPYNTSGTYDLFKDKFSFCHAGKSKIALNIIIAIPPSFVPHYTYTKDGERLFDISGTNSWKSQHARIMDSLLK